MMWTSYLTVVISTFVLLNLPETKGLPGDDLLLDPYDEVLDIFEIKTKSISLPVLDKIISKLFGRFKCTAAGNGCKNSLCLSAHEIFNVLAITEGKDLLEDDFDKLSVILTFHLLDLPKYCHQTVQVNQRYDTYKTQLQTRLFHDNKIKADLLEDFFDDLNKDLEKNDNDHEDDHDDSDHDDNDEDDHFDEDKKKKQQSLNKNDVIKKALSHQDDDDDDHDGEHDDNDDQDDHKDGKPNKKHDDDDDSDEKDDHDDDDSHEKDDDHDDDDDDHDDDDEFPKTIKKKCLSANTIFDELGHDPDDILDDDNLENLASLVIYHLISGARIKSDCRLLPRKSDFEKSLMSFLNAIDDQISFEDFENLMEKLGLDEDHMDDLDDHIDDHFDGDDHDHRRRRRRDLSNTLRHSLDKKFKHRRYTRDVSAQSQTQKMPAKCYTPKELLSIHNLKKGDNITKSKLMEIAPTLISQQVSGVCVKGPRKFVGKTTDAERFGYGTLAVLLICLCSVVGVLVVPCADKKVYGIVLALFIGLAVGSLVGDALLHLLPHAFGLHGHEGGGSHDKKHVWYALVAIVGIYAFYLLELVMAMLKGGGVHIHSNGYDMDKHFQNGKQDSYNIGSSKSTLYTDSSPDAHNMENTRLEDASIRNYGNRSLAFMVIIGDAIHNFADGLAIGAAFTYSAVVGLSTSITVFCHELPHELGDFAILLSTGIGLKKALLANFLSSLTAFLGLYIGLGISTEGSTRQWIFSIAAGMFIYIALVDMLPELIKGSNSRNRNRNIILNNVGIFIGLLIMLLLSVYEDEMMIKG